MTHPEPILTPTSLQMQRTFNVPPQTLYRAWTDPAILNQWFFPQDQLTAQTSVDLRIGGDYRIEMHPPEGDPFVVTGTYQELNPPHKLTFSWAWAHESLPATLITIELTELTPTQTTLTLTHSALSSEEERDNHTWGWNGTLEQLTRLLHTT